MNRIAKNVIETGGYDLEDMLRKLDALWLRGDLTEEEHTELTLMARDRAEPSGSMLAMVNDLSGRVSKLEACVGTPVTPNLAEDYPDYEAGRGYRPGDTCTFRGKRYVCKLPEGSGLSACPWSPETKPDCWQEA